MAKKNTSNAHAIHPGEILTEEFLTPFCITQYRLAHATGMPPRRVNEIAHGTRSITAATALRLARFFGTTAQFWMNLQTRYDLAVSAPSLDSLLKRIVTPFRTPL